ncbi:hypothetical protein ACFLRG_01400, partial [Bacteroidota bacterium]
GLIWSPVYRIKAAKKESVSTHIDRLHAFTWLIFFVNYVIILVFMKKLDYNICSLILMIAAGSVFMSGILIKFKPLLYSAAFIWIIAIISFFMADEYQLLMAAIASAGYLIPGYMLKVKYNKENV